MKHSLLLLCLLGGLQTLTVSAQDYSALRSSLTFHASFEQGLKADYSKGDPESYIKKGKELVPVLLNEDVKIAPGEGKFGAALWFPKKGVTRPQYKGEGAIGYNDKSWSRTVSVWLRLDPDKDLETGYCDPVQIVGDDSKKGFIFLEWSKDETPRFFRYAIRPLFRIWNPNDVKWDEIAAEKRPMVQVAKAPFSRDVWTHVVFTLESINDKNSQAVGRLYMNGELSGTIEGWDLTFGWDPSQVWLVLGAAYVGYMDDLAVFDRALTDKEIKQLASLKKGVIELRP